MDFKKRYSTSLKDIKWLKLRGAVLSRDSYRCTCCHYEIHGGHSKSVSLWFFTVLIKHKGYTEDDVVKIFDNIEKVDKNEVV